AQTVAHSRCPRTGSRGPGASQSCLNGTPGADRQEGSVGRNETPAGAGSGGPSGRARWGSVVFRAGNESSILERPVRRSTSASSRRPEFGILSKIPGMRASTPELSPRLNGSPIELFQWNIDLVILFLHRDSDGRGLLFLECLRDPACRAP